MMQKNVLITDNQELFIKSHPNFNFTAWVRETLDEYIRFVRRLNIVNGNEKIIRE